MSWNVVVSQYSMTIAPNESLYPLANFLQSTNLLQPLNTIRVRQRCFPRMKLPTPFDIAWGKNTLGATARRLRLTSLAENTHNLHVNSSPHFAHITTSSTQTKRLFPNAPVSTSAIVAWEYSGALSTPCSTYIGVNGAPVVIAAKRSWDIPGNGIRQYP